MKFGHIGIKVIDIERSIKFYEEVLDAKIIKDYVYPESRLVFMEIGGTIVELISKSSNESRSPGPIEHIAFKVDLLEEKMRMLDTMEIIYSEPRTVGNAKIIFFDGPNNEKFEFVTRA